MEIVATYVLHEHGLNMEEIQEQAQQNPADLVSRLLNLSLYDLARKV